MLSGWTYSQTITFLRTGLDGCQVRIDLHAQNADWTNIKSDGGDIRFTLSDDTQLFYWPERFDYANKVALFWVLLPSTQPASILVQYGNAGASTTASYVNTMQKKHVDSNTIAAYYFDSQTGTDEKATYPMTLNSVTWTTVDGGNMANYIGGVSFAGNHPVFNGSTSNASVSGLLNTPGTAGSIGFWMNPTSSRPRSGVTAGQRLFCKVNTLGPDNFIEAYINDVSAGGVDNGRIVVRMAVAGTTYTIKSRRLVFDSTRWYYVVVDFGALGLRIWVNGILEYKDTSVTGVFGNGTNDPFRFGCGYTNTNNFAGALSNLVVDNRQMSHSEVWARFQRRKYYSITTQLDRWVKGGQVFGDTAGRPQAGEASALVVGSTVYAYYAEANNSGSDIWQVYSKSTNGTTWTSSVQLLGNGIGSEAGDPLRNTIYFESGTYYLYYPVTQDGGASKDLFVATASSPEGPFTRQSTPVLLHDAPFQFIENPDLKKVGSTYVLIVDGAGTAGLDYPLRVATSSSPLGPFSFVSTSTLNSLRLGTGEGHAVWRMPATGGGYHVFYHAEEDGVLPGHTYYARSYEASLTALDNMIPSQFGPVRMIDTSDLYIDQWTDVTVFEFSGKTYMLRSEANNNGVVTARIQQDSYNGTLDSLVDEGLYTTEAVEPEPAVKTLMRAGKLLMRSGKLLVVSE